MKHLRFTLLFSLLFIFLVAFIPSAKAGTIKTVKGKKVMIEFSDETIAEGDEVYAINAESGKKMGIIKIEKVKGGKALGSISKGKATVGASTQTKGGSTSSAPATNSESGAEKTSSRIKRPKTAVGVLVGLLSSTIFIKDGVGDNNLAGTGFTLGGFYDYPALTNVSLRFMGGLENLSAKGGFNVDGSEGTVNISYLSLGGQVRYLLSSGASPFWVGIGGAYLMPMSNSSTKIKNAGANYYIAPGLGMDIGMGKNFLPVHLEYAIIPSAKSESNEVTVKSAILLRVGYSF